MTNASWRKNGARRSGAALSSSCVLLSLFVSGCAATATSGAALSHSGKYLRTSYDDDASYLIGRFFPNDLAPEELTENNARQTLCSVHIRSRSLGMGGSEEEILRQGNVMRRVHQTYEAKLVADVDMEALHECCRENPDHCPSRYIDTAIKGQVFDRADHQSGETRRESQQSMYFAFTVAATPVVKVGPTRPSDAAPAAASALASRGSTLPVASGAGALSLGSDYSCALTKSGGVKCWGWSSGEGHGLAWRKDNYLTPTEHPLLSSGVAAIASGFWHSCLLMQTGAVKCMGGNQRGQLGDGSTESRKRPFDVEGLSGGVVQIAVGSNSTHTCAVMRTGAVKCWGDNEHGQLGDGTTTTRLNPVEVVGLSSGVVAVAIGRDYTCALMRAGGVKCWGDNEYGQLGDGTTTHRTTPVNVAGLSSGIASLHGSWDQMCAVMKTGSVKCWGDDKSGSRATDQPELGVGVVSIAAQSSNTKCVLLRTGGVKCSGSNSDGFLGDGSKKDSYGKLVDVIGMSSGVAEIVTSGESTCAVMASGAIKCWGKNNHGQLGDGTTTTRLMPVHVMDR